jgi:Glycosyl transferase family 11
LITYRHLGTNGRLGNQLWQIAGTIGIAAQRNDDAAFPFWRYRPYFNVPDRYFPDLSSVASIDLGLSFLQDLRHFEAIEDQIRSYFKPEDSVLHRLMDRNADFFALHHKTALHVRRGDYLEWNQHHPLQSLEYYRQAMEMTNPVHVVFSDDPAWCRANLPGDCWFMEFNRDYEDLFLISSCDQVVTANSSFSWWGAWLSGNPAIYPREWYGPEYSFYDTEHTLPTNAVLL